MCGNRPDILNPIPVVEIDMLSEGYDEFAIEVEQREGGMANLKYKCLG